MKTWVDIFTFWLKIKFVQIIFYPIFSPLKYTFSCSENGLQSKSFLNGSKDWNQIWTFDHYSNNLLQGVPKRIGLLSSFEFLGLRGVFLGVKNNSKNFGNKKISFLWLSFFVPEFLELFLDAVASLALGHDCQSGSFLKILENNQ